MQHLTEEQLVAFHYRDLEAPEIAAAHVSSCAECAKQYEAIRAVLALVSEAPVPERSDDYGEQVWTRLRWKLGSRERRQQWHRLLAVAALLAVAFVAGHFWRARQQSVPVIAEAPLSAATREAAGRLLLVVVSDHLDSSERVLLEVANATAGTQLTGQPRRAEDLVAANRIYRLTAEQRGDERIAQLLADLEPILLEVANAGTGLEGKKLADLQKRIESKGLLFKVRVMSAPAAAPDTPRPIDSTTDTL